MRFEGHFQTVACDDCGRTISHLDDEGWEDNSLCSGCSARGQQEWDKTPCFFCKKPMKDEKDPYADEDASNWAHGACIHEAESSGKIDLDAEGWSSPSDW